MHHILIVEDQPNTAWALAEGLSDDGFSIDTFGTAEEALRWLRRGRSDLIITDLRLPGMSGLDLAHKVNHSRRAQPVIVVTAYGCPDAMREFQQAGVVECFLKPFRMDDLRRAVRRALAAAPRRLARPRPGRRAAA